MPRKTESADRSGDLEGLNPELANPWLYNLFRSAGMLSKLAEINVDELVHIEVEYKEIDTRKFSKISLILEGVASSLEKLSKLNYLYGEVIIEISLKDVDLVANALKSLAYYYTVGINPHGISKKQLVVSNMDKDAVENIVHPFIIEYCRDRKVDVIIKHSGLVNDDYIDKVNALRRIFDPKVVNDKYSDILSIPEYLVDNSKGIKIKITVKRVDIKFPIKKLMTMLTRKCWKKLKRFVRKISSNL